MWCILHIDKICKKVKISNKLNAMSNWKENKDEISACHLKFRKYDTFV